MTTEGDALLANLFAVLERKADDAERQRVVADFSTRHPELADDLAGLLDTARRLGAARPGDPSPPRQLDPGQRLGPFAVRRLIAVGGMGEIYEAEQAGLDRRVAVKVIRHGRISTAARDRFLHEQRALAQLHHTHIVPVYAAGEEGNLQFFAMPYIEGKTLAAVVARAAALASGPSPRLLGTLADLAADEFVLPPAGSGRPRLSRAYVRSVAEALAAAAEALDHAHRLGIYHRDLKPSNLMVGPGGQCWVIDFGLAAIGAEPGRSGGTLAYMAPEQHEGKAGPQSDVWGLGVTLYELLALRPAFTGGTELAVREAVLTHEPARPGALVGGVPAELESVCRKAMSRDPTRRYSSPAAFAADLRNWLVLRPTAAHRDRVMRPAWLWLRRNWRWATPLLLALAAGAALAAVRFDLNRVRADAAEQRERDGQRRERDLRREVLLQRLQQLRLTERVSGWSAREWDLARMAAEIDRDGVQPAAAVTLAGLDARRVGSWHDFDAGAVAFDPAGKQLLIGGWGGHPARVWVPGSARPAPGGPPGPGPVAFRADGSPVRLVIPTGDRHTLRVWDVAADRLLRELPLPGPAFPEAEGFALSADGKTAAAVAPAAGGRSGRVLVWDLTTDRRPVELEQDATAVTLSPDGALVAAGGEDGAVRVWPLPAGPVVVLDSGGTRVRSVAFGRSPQRDGPDRPGRGWLVAAGHAGGAVTVWDVGSRVVLSRPAGGTDDTFALAFSPDGTTLAGAGRYYPRLWDYRTGRPLLELQVSETSSAIANRQTGLAFSPDGQFLAVAGVAQHGWPGGAEVWELEPGRGIQELRALSGKVAQLRFSADGRRVVAMSYNWEVAAWEADSGRVLFRGAAPQGRYPKDHAALVFDATASRVACGAGRGARVWDANDGKLIHEYALPPGLGDSLAFLPSGKLLSVRVETPEMDRYPEEPEAPREQYPRVIRARKLPDGGDPPRELNALPWSIHAVDLVPDGRFAAADGRTGPGNDTARLFVFDPLAGRLLWSARLGDWATRQFYLNGAGDSLWYVPRGVGVKPEVIRANLATGQVLDPMPRPLYTFDRGGELEASSCRPTQSGVCIYSRGSVTPFLHLEPDVLNPSSICFDPPGRRVAWGRADGTVMVADLAEVRRRLSAIGLGW
jgi:serine/threonine protein kinase/WD40 repeat protein